LPTLRGPFWSRKGIACSVRAAAHYKLDGAERSAHLIAVGGGEVEKAVGIDPDANGFVCVLVSEQMERRIARRFSVSTEGLRQFVSWLTEELPTIVALEGIDGQSRPIEKTLREAGLLFYSFRPSDTEKYRKAVLGENKNNERDAEAVARFALSMKQQGKLERWRRVWAPDVDLRVLTRRYESVGKQLTGEVNRMWKLLRQASPDLYLALGGKLEEVECSPRLLKNEGILTLLMSKPQIGQWKELSEDELMEAMGGGEYKGRRAFVRQLMTITANFPVLSRWMSLVIQRSAQQVQMFKREQTELESTLEEIGLERPTVQRLKQMRGIGTITASGMVAEIIDIRRFPCEDNLASYSGLGKVEDKTGDRENMKKARKYNRRLKDLFMTAALNVVHFDPNSHLAGYHRNLVKRGMKPTEATKRVARALVRVICRELVALVEEGQEASAADEQQKGQSGVASGRGRGDKKHLSNTPPRSPRQSRTRPRSRVKRATGGTERTSSTKVVKRRTVRLTKNS
jgi:transposase